MEAIDELSQLSDSMRQAAALLADEDPDESSSSSRRPATSLNVVALGNVVGFLFLLFLLFDALVFSGSRWDVPKNYEFGFDSVRINVFDICNYAKFTSTMCMSFACQISWTLYYLKHTEIGEYIALYKG